MTAVCAVGWCFWLQDHPIITQYAVLLQFSSERTHCLSFQLLLRDEFLANTPKRHERVFAHPIPSEEAVDVMVENCASMINRELNKVLVDPSIDKMSSQPHAYKKVPPLARVDFDSIHTKHSNLLL